MNKYAPVKEIREYRFKQEEYALYAYVYNTKEHPDVWESYTALNKKRLEDKIYQQKSFLYCPKCHTISELQEDFVECPNCHARIYSSNCYIEPQHLPRKAIIYEMEDGTYAISFIFVYKTLVPIQTKNGTTALLKDKAYATRVVIAKNGHTYYRWPHVLRRNENGKLSIGKRVKGYKNYSPLTDITYRTFTPFLSITDVYCKYHCRYNDQFVEPIGVMETETARALHELWEKGILDVEAVKIRNRFRKLSDKYLAMIQDFRVSHKYGFIHESFHAPLQHLIGSIRMDMGDYEMLTMLMDKLKIRTKKLRKLFVNDPFNVANLLLHFRRIGFKDINNFYKLYDAYKAHKGSSLSVIYKHMCDSSESLYITKQFFDNYIQACGENVVVNTLIKCGTNLPSLYDTFEFIYKLKSYYHYTFTDYVSSIRTVHDTAHDILLDFDKRIGSSNSVGKIIHLHDEIMQERNTSRKRSLMFASMKMMEETLNHAIDYTKQELLLESEYNGISFVLPKDTDELAEAGKALHNCVGRLYRIKAYHKNCVIVLMKNHGKLTGCIELNRHDVIQAYGPCNHLLAPAEETAFNLWLARNPYFKEKLSVYDFKYNTDEYMAWYDQFCETCNVYPRINSLTA